MSNPGRYVEDLQAFNRTIVELKCETTLELFGLFWDF